MDWRLIGTSSPQQAQYAPFPVWQTPRGLNYSLPARLLSPDEFTVCTNWKLNDFGKLVTRDGLTKVTGGGAAGAGIQHIAYVPIGASTYIFVQDTDHKLYKLTGTDPNMTCGASIGTLDGDATLLPFGGTCVILDGGYIKYTAGVTVSLAYDNGEGTRGYDHNNTCASNDTSHSLYTGSKTRSGGLFTTTNWGSGTLPMLRGDFWLSKTGSPTGTAYCRLYSSDGVTLHATATTELDVSTLTTNATLKKFVFSGGYSLAANTSYRLVIVYSGGDASNYIKVHFDSVGSGGDGWYYEGAWVQDATVNCLMGQKPGLPPKGAFGDVWNNRLFVGGDPDYPGYVWYSNEGTVYDFSTESGGGYVGAVDEDANSFPVGGIVAHYGDLYVLGKQQQPYVCKITGTGPDDFALPPLFQRGYTDHKTLLSIRNDIWFANGDGVNNLAGVAEYGDLRTFSAADPVKPKLVSYWSTAAFAGYNSADGQYLLKLSGYTPILVCHTSAPYQSQRNGLIRYVWTEYTLTSLTPTAFAEFNNKFYVGCSNGHLYRLDPTVVADDSGAISIELKSGIIEFPFGSTDLREMYLALTSTAAATGSLAFYKDGSTSVEYTQAIAAATAPIQYETYMIADSMQLRLHTVTFTKPIDFQGIMFRTRSLVTRSS